MSIERATPSVKTGGGWSIVSQKPNGGLRTSQEEGNAVLCSCMGLQKAQRPRDTKGHFLSPSTQTLILQEEDITSSTLDPKRIGDKMYSDQTWRASYSLLRVPSLPSASFFYRKQRLGMTPWVPGANMALVLLNGGKWNYNGPKAGSSS